MGSMHQPIISATIRFAELYDAKGQRIYVGCVMKAGSEWVEVSVPEHLDLKGQLWVSFPPSPTSHRARAEWRAADRIGLVYLEGGPSEEQFAGIPGLIDLRPACEMRRLAKP